MQKACFILCVFFILTLVGSCGRQGGIPDSERQLYPKPLTEEEWTRPVGKVFDKYKMQSRLESAFFYHCKHSSKLEIKACIEVPYLREFSGMNPYTATYTVAVISLLKEEDDEPREDDYLVLFIGKDVLTKICEERLGDDSYGSAALCLESRQIERNPFVYLFYEFAGENSVFCHWLYRIDDWKLRKVWEYSGDEESHSGGQWFSVSNIKFQGLDSDERKSISVFTTFGLCDPDIPGIKPEDIKFNHKKTIYSWNSLRQEFIISKQTVID